MEPGDRPPKDVGDNSADRDNKGHFKPGHSVGEGTRYEKGHAPTSPGRPQTKHLTDALLKHLNRPVKDSPSLVKIAKKLKLDVDKVTGFEVLMECTAIHAASGKGDILKQVWERLEGSIPKTLNLSPTGEFSDYLDAMRGKTQFDPEEEPKETPDADA